MLFTSRMCELRDWRVNSKSGCGLKVLHHFHAVSDCILATIVALVVSFFYLSLHLRPNCEFRSLNCVFLASLFSKQLCLCCRESLL